MVTKTQSTKAETKTPDTSKTDLGAGKPRGGGDESFNNPEPTGEEVRLPSEKNPRNPSDQIYEQIRETDARTKVNGDEYNQFTDEQLKDAAVKMGIDGNDGLSRDEILQKISLWKASGKRMIPEEPGDYAEQKEDAKQDNKKNLDKLK